MDSIVYIAQQRSEPNLSASSQQASCDGKRRRGAKKHTLLKPSCQEQHAKHRAEIFELSLVSASQAQCLRSRDGAKPEELRIVPCTLLLTASLPPGRDVQQQDERHHVETRWPRQACEAERRNLRAFLCLRLAGTVSAGRRQRFSSLCLACCSWQLVYDTALRRSSSRRRGNGRHQSREQTPR